MNAHPQPRQWKPTPDEVQAAIETLLCADLHYEARRAVRDIERRKYAEACRDTAKGLLRTAREHRDMGNEPEMIRLVKTARWHWTQYVREITP